MKWDCLIAMKRRRLRGRPAKWEQFLFFENEDTAYKNNIVMISPDVVAVDDIPFIADTRHTKVISHADYKKLETQRQNTHKELVQQKRCSICGADTISIYVPYEGRQHKGISCSKNVLHLWKIIEKGVRNK